MIFKQIWERYFLRRLLVTFITFLLCSYALYVLIDYSSRSSAYKAIHLSFRELVIFYLYTFVQRADILVPLALLIANIRTLANLNIRNELVALMASGISLKRLLRPFLFFALLLVGLLYLNEEFLIPQGMKYFRKLEDVHFQDKYKTEKNESMLSIPLEDKSLLFYHEYESEEERFYDLFWIRSIDDIYRIKYLSVKEGKAVGKFVDHFSRQPSGEMTLEASFPLLELPDLRFSKNALFEATNKPHEQSLSQLWQLMPPSTRTVDERDALTLTAFYHKLAMPWLCLLAFLGPAPFCLRFTRQLPIFFIYLASMVAAIGFYLIIHAAIVLGNNQVVPPFLAIGIPFFTLYALCGWNYSKLQ